MKKWLATPLFPNHWWNDVLFSAAYKMKNQRNAREALWKKVTNTDWWSSTVRIHPPPSNTTSVHTIKKAKNRCLIYLFIIYVYSYMTFSLMALRDIFNPVYKHSGSITISLQRRWSAITSFISTIIIIFNWLVFFHVTVLNVQSHLHWTLYEIYEEHSSLNRVWTLPTQDSKI